MIVAFFENESELAAIRAWSAQQNTEPTLIAMTPMADWAAERQKVPHQTIEDLYSEDELGRLGMENFNKAEQLSALMEQELMPALQSLLPELKSPTSYYLFQFKLLLDGLLHAVFTVDEALRSLAPDTVVTFSSTPAPRSDQLHYQFEKLFPSVIQSVASHRNMSVTFLPDATPASEAAKTSARSSTEGNRWTWSRVRLAFFQSLQKIIRKGSGIFGGDSDRSNIAVIQPPPDLSPLRRSPAAWNLRFLPLQELLSPPSKESQDTTPFKNNLGTALRTVSEKLRGRPEFREIFRVREMDGFPLVEDRIQHFFSHILARHFTTHRLLCGSLPEQKIGAVLTCLPLYLPEGIACLTAARQHGIPIICLQHGGFQGYFDYPLLRYTDLQFGVDLYLCYGEGSKMYATRLLQSWGDQIGSGPQIQAVGSASMDKIYARFPSRNIPAKKKKLPAKLNVMYVPCRYSGNLRQFTWIVLPDIYYWRIHREVISTCCNNKNIHLTIKGFPHTPENRESTPNPIHSWLREKQFDNCTFVADGPLTQYLEDADLFVSDCLSTTTLQLVATDKPVILFTDERYQHLQPEADQSIRDRTHFCTTVPQYLKTIESVLQDPFQTPPDPNHTEFLDLYGRLNGTGQGVERCVAAIRKVMMRESE